MYSLPQASSFLCHLPPKYSLKVIGLLFFIKLHLELILITSSYQIWVGDLKHKTLWILRYVCFLHKHLGRLASSCCMSERTSTFISLFIFPNILISTWNWKHNFAWIWSFIFAGLTCNWLILYQDRNGQINQVWAAAFSGHIFLD